MSAEPISSIHRLRSRLSINALGIALLVAISVTWGTGLAYLAVRIGLPSPVRLALVEVVHVYVGLAAAVFLVAKIVRVGLRRRVGGVPELVLWQRWISYALAILYAAIFVSGAAAALPLGGRAHVQAVNAHLLTSVWALVPTALHTHAYRHRLTSMLWLRRTAAARKRLLAGIAIALVPAVALGFAPRALSEITRAGAGSGWRQSGLGGVQLSAIVTGPQGSWQLAGGDGLFYTRDGSHWRSVGLPSGGESTDRLIDLGIRPPAGPAPAPLPGAGHGGHSTASSVGAVTSIALDGAGGAVLVGTSDGIYFSPWAAGPYERLPLPDGGVRAIAVDPKNPYVIWVTATGGAYFSFDRGHGWTRYVGGLSDPATAYGAAFHDGTIHVSDATGVYRFDAVLQAWRMVARQRNVTALADSVHDGTLYAVSHTDGVRSLAAGATRWTNLEPGGDSHAHSGGAGHAAAVLDTGGVLLALSGDAVRSSADRGATWDGLGGGFPEGAPAAATVRGDTIALATSAGVYAYPLDPVPPPTFNWWLAVIAAALLAGAAGIGIAALPPDRPGAPAGSMALQMIRRTPRVRTTV